MSEFPPINVKKLIKTSYVFQNLLYIFMCVRACVNYLCREVNVSIHCMSFCILCELWICLLSKQC